MAFSSNDPSLNPAIVCNFNNVHWIEKDEKEIGIGTFVIKVILSNVIIKFVLPKQIIVDLYYKF